jgi:hypothetical protein
MKASAEAYLLQVCYGIRESRTTKKRFPLRGIYLADRGHRNSFTTNEGQRRVMVDVEWVWWTRRPGTMSIDVV